MVIELSDMEFEHRVSDGISFVKIWSPVCQPCKMYKGIFEAFSSKHEDIQCYSVNAFECPNVITQFKAKQAPTTLVLKDGELITMQSGVIPMDELESLIPTDL